MHTSVAQYRLADISRRLYAPRHTLKIVLMLEFYQAFQLFDNEDRRLTFSESELPPRIADQKHL